MHWINFINYIYHNSIPRAAFQKQLDALKTIWYSLRLAIAINYAKYFLPVDWDRVCAYLEGNTDESKSATSKRLVSEARFRLINVKSMEFL